VPVTRTPDRRPYGTAAPTYDQDVFINCPFDECYRPIRDALIFAVFDCGLRPRCALEVSDSGEVRIDKIAVLIRDCRWGIHDISRTELGRNGLPRFNMPFELGFFLGALRFGNREQRNKFCLVLDRAPYRFQKYLSDIAGQDVVAHNNSPSRVIEAVRNWLAGPQPVRTDRLHGGEAMAARYRAFRRALPRICAEVRRKPERLTFTDYCEAVSEWLRLTEDERRA